MANDPEENDEDYYDSGPYCRHWRDPWECEVPCSLCGHTCAAHPPSGVGCGEEDCGCPAFEDEDDP